MVTKKYGTVGLMEWVCSINVGQAHFSFHFSGGMLNGYGMTPATFTTSNAVQQYIIENSEHFRRGKIKLLATYGEEEKPKTTEKPKETAQYADVKNSQQAKAVLMAEPYNIPLSELGNKESILAAAKKAGVTFPNWG